METGIYLGETRQTRLFKMREIQAYDVIALIVNILGRLDK
jgi:hypothetical protein